MGNQLDSDNHSFKPCQGEGIDFLTLPGGFHPFSSQTQSKKGNMEKELDSLPSLPPSIDHQQSFQKDLS